MVILGVIAVIIIPQLALNKPTKEGQETLAKKMAEYLTQASTEILIYHAGLDDFTSLKDNEGVFSIEDAGVTKRMAELYQRYLSDVDLKINTSKSYFSQDLKDFDNKPIGLKLNDAYSDFFFVNDGMIIGFRLYSGCEATEENSIPPTFRQRMAVDDVCGSVFYDTNAFGKPNKLGTDQFIIPLGKRGIKYENITTIKEQT